MFVSVVSRPFCVFFGIRYCSSLCSDMAFKLCLIGGSIMWAKRSLCYLKSDAKWYQNTTRVPWNCARKIQKLLAVYIHDHANHLRGQLLQCDQHGNEKLTILDVYQRIKTRNNWQFLSAASSIPYVTLLHNTSQQMFSRNLQCRPDDVLLTFRCKKIWEHLRLIAHFVTDQKVLRWAICFVISKPKCKCLANTVDWDSTKTVDNSYSAVRLLCLRTAASWPVRSIEQSF